MRFSIVALLLAVGSVDAFSTPSLRTTPTLVPQASVSFSNSYAPIHSAGRKQTQLFADAAAVPAPEEDSSSATSGGTATISNEIFNLVKGIVGAGVLSLPAGK
jgi:hypothetical protein